MLDYLFGDDSIALHSVTLDTMAGLVQYDSSSEEEEVEVPVAAVSASGCQLHVLC